MSKEEIINEIRRIEAEILRLDESKENYPVRLTEHLGKLCMLAYENGYSPKLRRSKTHVFPEYIKRTGD